MNVNIIVTVVGRNKLFIVILSQAASAYLGKGGSIFGLLFSFISHQGGGTYYLLAVTVVLMG